MKPITLIASISVAIGLLSGCVTARPYYTTTQYSYDEYYPDYVYTTSYYDYYPDYYVYPNVGYFYTGYYGRGWHHGGGRNWHGGGWNRGYHGGHGWGGHRR